MKRFALAVAGASLAAFLATPAWAQADKLAVAASTTDLMWCSDDPGTLGGTIKCVDMINNDGAAGVLNFDALDVTTTILQTAYKISTSGDLIIDVNLECMLFNEVRSTKGGDEISTSTAGLLVFAVVDDDQDPFDVAPDDATPARFVGVQSADTSDEQDDIQGVRFCSRLVELEIGGAGFENDDFVRALIASESTHGFKWVAPDPAEFHGNNLWVTLVGVIDEGPVGGKGGDQVSGVGFGKRLMTVDTVHLPKGGDDF